ncbi:MULTISPECIES: EscU/YscU/HrcU family type III secretion system export apparatus switch protein [unclassified Anaerobiospirillum]|uniref:EscU/YscU/HrcU family type III secretion system export apparatus switch protein n=1 Tax=unclassified Anaerobiospirillum TaxID=2647410 RepID=UPI001FF3A52B|nr:MULTISPECIES: EscU/YscU/HrcU family type III secretion system export apparatus switch protein [unclassified Anaerobiospirillum]MCK0526738.1 EscU/YscU/HrcU family type III secretion system export apparatus switch protein [Anaerobiospirillum sp. NML120449]MCK0535007.1 EscU/YscU/HrcU family type III secretion system export apparatus switch protein [Anaerobiospirillum sp. NML120511]MCK0540229.1 EscU/YscU/HrcU family type III secretion system export apparatus switch protein [Anaerobiospirillum sp.
MFSSKSSYSRNKSGLKEAVGLSYDEESRSSPVVSSKGEGAMAEAIIDMAKELGLYVHKDEQLMSQLRCLKEGEEIPRELFEVISQILAFSYLLQGKTPASWTRADGTRAINVNA